MNIRLLYRYSINFVENRSCRRGDETFLICHIILSEHVIKGHMTLWTWISHSKLSSYEILCLKVSWKRRCSVSNHVTAWSWIIWHSGWNSHTFNYYCVKCDAYRYYQGCDITILFSSDYIIRDMWLSKCETL